MAQVTFLGTASAVAYEGHENTFFAVEGESSTILVDCPARPLRRLEEGKVQTAHLDDLIITHFHADHVSGLPNLLMDMWLLGRKKEFTIHGNSHSISRTQKMMDLFEWDTWTGMYPVNFHVVPDDELALVLDTAEFKILASPVKHMIPTLGLRFEYLGGECVLAYSGDTTPIEGTVRLARSADILIHEAAGSGEWHSSAAEAGEIAARAGVTTLYLIHYSLREETSQETLLAEAKKTFAGKVFLAEDLLVVDCPEAG